MKEFLIVTFSPPMTISNIVLQASSKKGAYNWIKTAEDKNTSVINIIEL